MELTKNDIHDIECLIDIQIGMQKDKLNQLCQTAIHWDALHKKDNPLKDCIRNTKKAYDRYTEISEILEQMRNEM